MSETKLRADLEELRADFAKLCTAITHSQPETRKLAFKLAAKYTTHSKPTRFVFHLGKEEQSAKE